MNDFEISVMMWFLPFHSAMLDHFFSVVTTLGNTMFYFLAIPLFWHLRGQRFGSHLLFMVNVALCVVLLSKHIIERPRPFTLEPALEIMIMPYGSMPSGHALAAIMFWSMVLYEFKHKALSLLAWSLIILVPLSRVYLGVHYPTDILAGGAIGLALAMVHHHRDKKWFSFLDNPTRLTAHNAILIFTAFECLMLLTGLMPLRYFLVGVGSLSGLMLGLVYVSQRPSPPSPMTSLKQFVLLYIGVGSLSYVGYHYYYEVHDLPSISSIIGTYLAFFGAAYWTAICPSFLERNAKREA